MLSQFTFKNFKCFKDETTLDMQAASITELEESIIKDKNDNERFTSVAAIYGPNGSGKSTLLEAVDYLTRMITEPVEMFKFWGSKDSIRKTAAIPFMLDDFSKDNPTEFHIIFRHNDREFSYYISFLKRQIINERLIENKIGEKKINEIFYREENKIINASLLKGVAKTQIALEMPYLVFLKINYDIAIINEVIAWFNKCKYVYYGGNWAEAWFESNTLRSVSKKEEDSIIKLLNEVDINISDMKIERDDEGSVIGIKTVRHHEGKKYYLDFHDESSGTIKMMELLPEVLSIIKNAGLLIVDELDSKLHPKLLKYIIKIFKNPTINRYGAQLLFTSHDLTTMKNDLFRRDEIWFTTKNKNDASELYSLIELRDEKGELIRKNARFDKQYFAGRYGADPYLQNIIDWEVLIDEQEASEKK